MRNFTREQIGTWLKTLRMRKNMTQIDAALLLNVSQSRISKMESGKLALDFHEALYYLDRMDEQKLLKPLLKSFTKAIHESHQQVNDQ